MRFLIPLNPCVYNLFGRLSIHNNTIREEEKDSLPSRITKTIYAHKR